MHIDELMISESSRNVLRSCARKLEFKKFYNHSPRTESLPAGSGIALHAAFQDYLINRDLESAAFQLLLHFPFQFETNPERDRSVQACFATLQAMIDFSGYGHYELAYIEVDGEKRPAIEVPFQINIADFSLSDEKEIPVKYIGYIDVVFYDIVAHEFIVLDIKTHRNKAADMSPVYKFQDQCLPYAMVLERALNRPIASLDVRYFSCYVDVVEPQVSDYQFTKTKEDIDDWAKGLALDLQLLKLYYQTSWFPRNGNACTAYNRVCANFDFCASRDERVIEQMLSFETPTPAREFTPWISLDLELTV